MTDKVKVEIPDVIDEKLSRHSKQFGIELDILEEELQEYIPEIKEENPKATIKKQIGLAYRRLVTRLAQEEGSTRSNAVAHTVFFIGDTGIEDATESMRRKILRMTPDEQQTYHPSKDVWLDYREGDNHLNPIEPLDHRTLYGIGSSGSDIDESRLKFVKLDLWRDVVRQVAPTFDVPYRLRAKPRDTDRQLGFLDLSGVQTTRLRPATELTEEEKEHMIRNCGKDIFGLDELDILYKTRFDGQFNAEPIFIEAYVSTVIIKTDTEAKSNLVEVYGETDSGMVFARAYVPQHLTINFKEEDKVIFLTELGEITTSTNDKFIGLYVKGFFKVPESEADEYV